MLKNLSIISLPIITGLLAIAHLITLNDIYLFMSTCLIGIFMTVLLAGCIVVYIKTDRFIELATDADMLMLSASILALLIYLYAVFFKIFLS